MLETKDVSKRFGGITALESVSLSINKKELVGIIGPNGSGKTTLLNVISGLVRPDRGDVYLDGRVITKWPVNKRVRHGIARTFQQPRVFPRLTVLDNVKVATADEVAVAEALRAVGLWEKRDLKASKLNMYEIRLLELARCLAIAPRYILLDEPMAGLVSSEAEKIATVIKSIYGTGISIVIVEHKISHLAKLVEKIVVMNAGRVIAQGNPGEVLENPEVLKAYFGV